MGDPHHRVIVIGSGVSGLACARELVHRGYQVLVVEARGRVGGRLKGEALRLQRQQQQDDQSSNKQQQQQKNYHAVDLGGALIHGINENPIHTVTSQMGVPLHEISDYCLLLDDNGWPFDPKLDEKLSTLFNECLDVTFQRIADQKRTANGESLAALSHDYDNRAQTTTTKETADNFGDLFDQVCQDKGVKNHASHPLFQWHQANLELPTGAGFHELGYTWNDDEPYGFTGAHSAPEFSWKFVMDHLSDGLDILYDSPVTRIQVVLPDGKTPTTCPVPPLTVPTTSEALPSIADEAETKQDDENKRPEQPIRIITRTEWRSAPKASSASPSRRSRRIRGEDINLRRSGRATKGIIQKLTVGHDKGVFSYDDPSKKPKSSNRKRKSSTNGGQENAASKVQVTLQNGTVLEADAVVCTLPLGILKIPPNQPGYVSFVPPLPAEKRAAIQQLGCGLLNKCAISFQNIFWQDSDFLGLAEKAHSYLVLNVTNYTGKPILIFMYGGTFAKEVESWTDADIVGDCLAVLKRICGKEVPAPVDYCVTRWGKEQYSRMAFTYIPPGVDGPSQLAAAGEAIHDPALPEKPLILFAGEHTTPYHPSTMHGAFLSGIREAYRYDIFVAPELNGNLEFETDHQIYEYTFPVKRAYRGLRFVNKLKQETAEASSQIRSRRRRFANMTLRKSPARRVLAEVGTPTAAKQKTEMTTPDAVGSRRSQRSLSAKKAPEVSDLSPSYVKSEFDLEEEQRREMNELEGRVLKRAVESYGRNYNFIRSKVLPVYGATQKRSLDQLRHQVQQHRLMPVTIRNGKRQTTSDGIPKAWQAKTVAAFVSTADSSFFETTKEQGNDENVSSDNVKRRRSGRAIKPKVLPDV